MDVAADSRSRRLRLYELDFYKTVVLAVHGEVDVVTAPHLAQRTATILNKAPEALVIDLTGVQFLSSAGLEVLIDTYQNGVGATRVVVVADGPYTARPMKLTGVDSVVPVFAERAEALLFINFGRS